MCIRDRVPADEALAYVIAIRPVVEGEDKQADFSTVQAVLDGVRDLLSERWAEAPALVRELREWLWAQGLFCASLVAGKDENRRKLPSFAITLTTANRSRACLRIVPWPCCAGARRTFCRST